MCRWVLPLLFQFPSESFSSEIRNVLAPAFTEVSCLISNRLSFSEKPGQCNSPLFIFPCGKEKPPHSCLLHQVMSLPGKASVRGACGSLSCPSLGWQVCLTWGSVLGCCCCTCELHSLVSALSEINTL